MQPIAFVKQLWHYPVKSMLGENRSHLDLDWRGVARDRLLAVQNQTGKLASGKNTRRFFYLAGLFDFAVTTENDLPIIHFPDGQMFSVDDLKLEPALSKVFAQDLKLSQETTIPHMDAGSVHLLTTSSLAWLNADARRFRPNMVLQTPEAGLLEQTWLGQVLRIGDTVRLKINQPTERCAMVGFAQSDLPADPKILKTIAGTGHLDFGVYAQVLTTGRIFEGDAVFLEPQLLG